MSKLPSLSGADEGEMVERATRAEAEPERLILRIYAGDIRKVEDAVERIDEFIKDEFCSEVSL